MSSNPWEKEFPQDPELCYLNHAAVAPWPQRTAMAVTRFAEENVRHGATYYQNWLGITAALREQLRKMINAPAAEDIALLKNTSEGLSVIAYGLEWRPGDNIVITDQEFPSNRIVWESLHQYGVKVREASMSGPGTPEENLIAATDRNTKLMAVSSVQYATGLRLNLKVLGEFCHTCNILYVIDAIQSLGAENLDVQEIAADFIVADAHKWLLGPEGIALFYCRAELRDRMKLYEYGWHMVEDVGNYNVKTWRPARSARRFECGSPNMLGIVGFNASLSLLWEVGFEEISRSIISNTTYIIESLKNIPRLEIVSSQQPRRYLGIVTFKYNAGDPDPTSLFKHLTERRVICAMRAGGIRFSPHFYTSALTLERAIEAVKDFCISK